MTERNSIYLELALVICTAIICSIFLLQSQLKDFQTPHSWAPLTAKLLKIQKSCRNATALRSTGDSIEFINSDGLLMKMSVTKDFGSVDILELQISNQTTIKERIKITELSNLILDFQEPNPGTLASDATLKGIFATPELQLPVVIFLDLSLSNPNVFQELNL